jgi:hypothetical protein
VVLVGQVLAQESERREVNLPVFDKVEDLRETPREPGSRDSAEGFTLAHLQVGSAEGKERGTGGIEV